MADDEKPGSTPDDDGRPPVSREALRAYLDRPATYAKLKAYVARAIPAGEVEPVAHDVLLKAWASPWLPSDEASLDAWLRGVADHVIADVTKKRVRRARYEGELPKAPVYTDEAGEPAEAPEDAVVDVDPSYDPETDSFQARGRMLRDWLEEQTAKNPRDAETFAMMVEWADEGKTYEQIAAERGLTVAAVTQRIFKLKRDYGPAYEKHRNRALLLMFLGATVVVSTLVAIVYLLLRRAPHEDITPGPPVPWPAPSASVQAPPEEPFMPAEPTPEKPRGDRKEPARR